MHKYHRVHRVPAYERALSSESSDIVYKRYSKPLSELFNTNNPVRYRPSSMLIYHMMAKSGASFSKLSDYLLCTIQALRNKLNRSSCSVDDLVAAAEACDYEIVIRKKDGSEEEVIDPMLYFLNSDNGQGLKISEMKEKERLQRIDEYEYLKRQLKKMEDEYDFLKKNTETKENDLQ